MRSRRLFLPAVFAALAAMLFAQAAIALANWSPAPGSGGHCEEQAPTANVCFQHCEHNDLTLDIPRVKVPAPVAVPALTVLLAPVRYPQVAPQRIAALPAGPPPRILFQSFLI
jgi:hypothetical protein